MLNPLPEPLLQPLAYCVEDVPRVSGLTRTRVFEAIREKRLTARKDGRQTIIEADELRRYLTTLPTKGRELAEVSRSRLKSKTGGRAQRPPVLMRAFESNRFNLNQEPSPWPGRSQQEMITMTTHVIQPPRIVNVGCQNSPTACRSDDIGSQRRPRRPRRVASFR